jgi:thiamine-phosphate pyrophosphorylase
MERFDVTQPVSLHASQRLASRKRIKTLEVLWRPSMKHQSQFSLGSKLYAITDVNISQLSHAAQVRRLCEGGARLIQLREKHLSPREFYREAQAALDVARSYGARIIINDRVDLAAALKADGVHLGQKDLPPEAARALLGDEAIIGASTHNLRQAAEAAKLPLDYIAIGPIFSTATKTNPEPVVGPERLHEIRKVVGRIPLVAIGGITLDNASQVIFAGADAVATVAALLNEPSRITMRTQEMLARLEIKPFPR